MAEGPKWHFVRRDPRLTVRDPIHEDFSDESVDRPAQALVREAIQNSLDARNGDDVVCVRFFISGRSHALSPDRARVWFGDAWPHLTADANGLRAVPPAPVACPFIVVEDFGTIGLKGDPGQSLMPARTDENHFFGFFRAEGLSTKTTDKGGRWGVGKFIFMRSSSINTMLGLTVRADDRRRLLMGWTVLKHHRLNNTEYTPDGRMGVEGVEGAEPLILPIEDAQTIDQLIRDFSLRRDRGVPGLSVIVPYCDGSIDVEDVRKAVLRDYFYPILFGRLNVIIDDASESQAIRFDAESLPAYVADEQSQVDRGLKSVIDLDMWAREAGSSGLIEILDCGKNTPPQWSESLFPEGLGESLARKFRLGESLALRVPVWIHEIGKRPIRSYFDLYIQHDRDDRGYPPVYIRNGIVIPRVRERRVYGHRVLVIIVVDDAGLGQLLGDAETPAHTHWSKDTEKFKNKYEHGEQCINFVKDAPAKLADILSRVDDEVDRFILASFFPRPAVDEGLPDPNRPDSPDTPVPPRPPVTSKPFRIDQFEGGFTVAAGDRRPLPSEIEICIAYDRTRGNPLKKYHKADFQIKDLQVDLAGVTELSRSDNQIRVRIVNEAFRVRVTGFDTNRDLYVRAAAKDTTND